MPASTRRRRRNSGSALQSISTALQLASQYGGSGAWLDSSGHGINIQLGSAAGADANDPVWLPYTGATHIYSPGVTGNYVSVPDSDALDPVGDMEVRFAINQPDWTKASGLFPFGKWNGDPGVSGWYVSIQADTKIGWGITGVDKLSTAAIPVADGTIALIRIVEDVDNGAGGYDIKFYYKLGVSEANIETEINLHTGWTQLGTTVTTAGATPRTASANALGIGAINGTGLYSERVIGKYYRAQIYSGIAGTKVFDMDFTNNAAYNVGSTTVTAVTGQVGTINRSATGLFAEVVNRSLFMCGGVDDYGEMADNPLLDFGATDPFTLLVGLRKYDTPVVFERLISKIVDQVTGEGYEFGINGTTRAFWGQIADGAVRVSSSGALSPAFAAGVDTVGAFRRSVVLDQIHSHTDGVPSAATADTTTASLANALPLWIGETSVPGIDRFFRGSLFGLAIIRQDMTDADILARSLEMKAS